MSIASRIEQIEEHIGDIYDTVEITGVDTSQIDKNLVNVPKQLKLGLVDTINNGTDTLYENFPKVTGEGSSITLNDTYNCKMKIDMGGDTEQESTTGKNLLNVVGTNTSLGITSVGTKDGKITSTGTTTGTSYTILDKNINLSQGDYILSLKEVVDFTFKIRITFSDNTNAYYRLNSNTKYVNLSLSNSASSIRLYVDSDLEVGQTINRTFYPMLRLASITDDNFEPYTGNSPSPSPDYPQNIEVVTGLQEVDIVGKNLFDKDNANILNAYLADGGALASNGNYRTLIFNSKPNTTYTISKVASLIFRVAEYQNMPTLGSSYTNRIKNDNATSITYTTSNIGNFIVVTFKRDTDTKTEEEIRNSIQIEKNSQATTYKAFESQNYQINLGKNLVDFSTISYLTYNSATITKEGSTYIVANGSSQYGSCAFAQANLKLKPNTTYTFSAKVSSTNTTSGASVFVASNMNTTGTNLYGNLAQSGEISYCTFTTPSTMPTGDSARIGLNPREANKNATFTDIQIEKGNQKTSYSTYFTPIELCKIGDYRDRIKKSTGKNLFDKDNANILNANIAAQVTLSTNARTLYISCEPNTSYTISKKLSSRLRVGTTNETPIANVTVYDFSGNDSGTYISITTNSTAKYLCVYYYLYGTDTLTEQEILDSIMINEGSTALPYEPYGTGWYIKKEIGKVVLDGSESDWAYISSSVWKFRYTLNDANFTNNSLTISQVFSDYFTRGIWNNSNDNQMATISSAPKLIGIRCDNISSLEDFKTWLSTHNTEVYYVLANPTYTTITETDYQELYNQLLSFQNAISYNEQTNINVQGNLPSLLEVVALGDEE